jgi:ATP-dependent Clp protease ATP-binding subunit ClpX
MSVIARQAIEQGTGARGLRGAMDGVLRKTMYEMLSYAGSIGCVA